MTRKVCDAALLQLSKNLVDAGLAQFHGLDDGQAAGHHVPHRIRHRRQHGHLVAMGVDVIPRGTLRVLLRVRTLRRLLHVHLARHHA